jgi:uncharacterized delta-60 repeat protein
MEGSLMKRMFWFTLLLSVLFLSLTVVAQFISLPAQPQGKFAERLGLTRQESLEKTSESRLSPVVRRSHVLNASSVFPDSTFGTNGSVRTFISGGIGSDIALSVAMQSDGKIVAAGLSGDASGGIAFAVARYNTDGTLDGTFGNGGTVRNFVTSNPAGSSSVAIQSDGKIVTANYGDAFTLARYKTDGTLDSTFGNGGKTSNNVSGPLPSVAIESDGKIVVACFAQRESGGSFALERYNTNGTLDSSFGNNGTTRNFINGGSSNDAPHSVAIQSDGKIVVAGVSGGASASYAFALARYNTDGTLDGAFGSNGTVRNYIGGSGNNDAAQSVAIQYDGKIVAAGGGSGGFALARYKADGTLDSTFGAGGTSRIFISGGNNSGDEASSVAMQTDGKIVVAGSSPDASGHFAFALARCDADGSLDSTFGTNGTLRTFISGGNNFRDEASSMVIQSDGRIVAAGTSFDASDRNAFAVARFVVLPDKPVLVSPVDTTGQPRRTSLKWIRSTITLKYHLQIAADSAFSAVVFDTTMIDTSTKLSTPLAATTRYYWHVSAIGTGGTSDYSATANFTTGTGIDAVDKLGEIPKEFALFQNYPNPFNPTTGIGYQLSANSYVTLKVYDVLGREVRTLVSERQTAGSHSVTLYAANLPSGVYFYRLEAGRYHDTKKLLLLK